VSGIKLVSSDPQLSQLLREAGMQSAAMPVAALATLAAPGAPQPQVLVVDLRERGEFPPALAQLKRQHPTTAVLLVVSQLDPMLMLEAMRAGVNECVTYPVEVDELRSALQRLTASVAVTSRGEMFAFIGAKGGVGATTVAVNVATALAKLAPDSTLLIDLHASSGDAAVFLGEEPRFSVVDAVENVHRLDAAYLQGLTVRSKSGLDLLGSSGRPVTAGFDTVRTRTLLDFANQTRRYTVLDVPRSDRTVLDALELTTRIVLVANQELATVRSASRIAATLGQRYGKDRLELVLTRTDKRAEIGQEDVQRTVGLPVRHTFPSDYRMALQAMNRGRPVVLDNHNDLSGAFAAFARGLAGLADSRRDQKAVPGTMFGRLAPRRV
jgi:pilus assembly protein CpaE